MDIAGKNDTMLNEETISNPKKTDLLPEKVMPFSQTIEVAFPPDKNQEELSDLDTLTDILIVVNGEIKLRYTNEPERMGYRNWGLSNVTGANSNTYLCPVTTEDTKDWRGMVQAFIKQRRLSLTDNSEESPYDIVPLFIAKRAPGNDGGATGTIELGYEMNVTNAGMTFTIIAELQNTSGKIAIEAKQGDNWNLLTTLDGAKTRKEVWISDMGLWSWSQPLPVRVFDLESPENIHANIIIPYALH